MRRVDLGERIEFALRWGWVINKVCLQGCHYIVIIRDMGHVKLYQL